MDGEVRTACQDACPADAIVFGNVNDPTSKVAKLKASQRGFLSLEEVNARPNVTYLTKVRNRAPGGYGSSRRRRAPLDGPGSCGRAKMATTDGVQLERVDLVGGNERPT